MLRQKLLGSSWQAASGPRKRISRYIPSNQCNSLKVAELVAGLKEDFAAEVVENSGNEPSAIIKNSAQVLGKYWYANVAVDFLDDGVAVNGEFFSLMRT